MAKLVFTFKKNFIQGLHWKHAIAIIDNRETIKVPHNKITELEIKAGSHFIDMYIPYFWNKIGRSMKRIHLEKNERLSITFWAPTFIMQEGKFIIERG